MRGNLKWKYISLVLAVVGLLCGCAVETKTEVAIFQTDPTATTQMRPISASFPIALPDSRLVVEELRQYQGPYWEDGSGDFVEDVAALMICNPTDRMIAFAAFGMDTPDGTLYFFAYRLPPKSRCMVLEYGRKSCDPKKVLACRELMVRWDTQELSREQINYVGCGPQMTIVNRDSRKLDRVTVWYKQYVQTEDYYLGGAAYSVDLFCIQPEEQRTFMPQYYDAAHARIVAIELQT